MLKYPFCKTNNGQFALSYIGPIFWYKTPDILKCSIIFSTLEHNLKTNFFKPT